MKFKYIHQSSWLGDALNKFFLDKNDGTFLEVGVGNIISHDFCLHPEKYRNKKWDELPILGSNTIELLQKGWTGWYFDPVPEFVEQAELLAPDKNKIYTKAVGLGKTDEELVLRYGETFLGQNTHSTPDAVWINKSYKIENANKALEASSIPNVIDFFSLDVEGFELNVLESIDLTKYRFNSIVVEVDKVPVQHVQKILNDYQLIYTDRLNALFKHNKFGK